MKKLLKWFDLNILTVFSFFLIVFIPLYPKLPLFEAIPGYIVRVRLEDILLLLGFLIFIIQVIRKKATLKSVIFWPIVIYIVIGFLSSLSAIFITKTVPTDKIHVVKLFLHWFRRIEYFSIFFIFYNGIRNKMDARKITILSLVTVLFVSLYGYGQKYLYWPVYSTMNREFSKGIKLYLTEHARVPSTFGGHYDLAAYLVVFLTLFISLFLVLKRKNIIKWVSLVVFLFGYWLLILTASRTSYIAYLGAVTVLILILSFKKESLKKGIVWGLSRWFSLIIFSLFIMTMFGDLSDRFAHILGMPKIRDKLNLDYLTRPLKPNPPNAIQLTDDIALVMDRTDERPTIDRPDSGSGGDLPPDVYEDIPDGYEESTESATLSGAINRIPKKRTFSDNAYQFGLSTAIRLDALWPRAIAGFKRNPLLGSGYSTLTKEAVSIFTEAESTDNDYLRTLGETGALGFISFFAVIFIVLKTIFKNLKKTIDPISFSLFVAFIAFTFGLLINALYIDVFEASKVAFMFWALTGVVLAVIEKNKGKKAYEKK
ncbi:O-antigen ligase family protein [Patescibacteria group bacterium]